MRGEGYEQPPAKLIAKRAGISRKTVHHHCHVMSQVVAECERRILAEFSEELSQRPRIFKNTPLRLFDCAVSIMARRRGVYFLICTIDDNWRTLYQLCKILYFSLISMYPEDSLPAPESGGERMENIVFTLTCLFREWATATKCDSKNSRCDEYIKRMVCATDLAARNRLP